VRYEPDSYILFRRNSVFKGLNRFNEEQTLELQIYVVNLIKATKIALLVHQINFPCHHHIPVTRSVMAEKKTVACVGSNLCAAIMATMLPRQNIGTCLGSNLCVASAKYCNLFRLEVEQRQHGYGAATAKYWNVFRLKFAHRHGKILELF
jgi:hypothetical protein